jgi:hypothetical protein
VLVNVNDLLFRVGDLKTGKVLHRVEVTGFRRAVKRTAARATASG